MHKLWVLTVSTPRWAPDGFFSVSFKHAGYWQNNRRMIESKREETQGKGKSLESERTVCWELVNGLSESQEVSRWFGHLASTKTDVSRHNLSHTSDNRVCQRVCVIVSSHHLKFDCVKRWLVINFYIKIVTTTPDVSDFRQDHLGLRQQPGFHLNEKGN